ncbi:hypothetical protein QFZ29_001099 [Agromyces albus]|nr:hypothetical protein [Agromyces albus]
MHEGGGADQRTFVGEPRGHDGNARDERERRAFGERLTCVLEERGGDPREPAADRDDIEVEQVGGRGDRVPYGPTRAGDCGDRDGVSRGVRLGECFARLNR